VRQRQEKAVGVQRWEQRCAQRRERRCEQNWVWRWEDVGEAEEGGSCGGGRWVQKWEQRHVLRRAWCQVLRQAQRWV
jgi:hypothetical protein